MGVSNSSKYGNFIQGRSQDFFQGGKIFEFAPLQNCFAPLQNFDFGNFLIPPLISKNLKTQIQILKMLICRGVIISFPPSPTKAVYEMKPYMFLPVQCIADEKYHFNMTLISAFVTIQRSYTIISFSTSRKWPRFTQQTNLGLNSMPKFSDWN